ncbi:hypothetical protein RZE82_02050 [Mollicutes bacterium LVI A0039]|nr:hypothetical protein RZE82_02050 [Mollicutes bacterium LVI A0039]
MATKAKIKIVDNNQLRTEIDELYKKTSQINLAKWSLSIAKHILDIVDIDYNAIDQITEGFHTNELWQLGNARMHEVRQAGFKIHKVARECDNEINIAAIRVVGHAVATGHMSEHAMVASDYAVKTIGLLSATDINAISGEREWQLQELKRIFNDE